MKNRERHYNRALKIIMAETGTRGGKSQYSKIISRLCYHQCWTASIFALDKSCLWFKRFRRLTLRSTTGTPQRGVPTNLGHCHWINHGSGSSVSVA
jgi:hypothetical protein